jgi:hypothetical protein
MRYANTTREPIILENQNIVGAYNAKKQQL